MTTPGPLRVAEALSTQPLLGEALAEVIDQVKGQAGGHLDIAVLHYSPHFCEQAQQAAEAVQSALSPDALVGCAGLGVIGGGREVQDGPALSLWAARLPGARVQAYSLSVSQADDHGYVHGWPDVDADASGVLLADPRGFPLRPFLDSLRRGGRYPQVIGGIASGGEARDGGLLISNDQVLASGAVGFVMDGSMRLTPLVSQGCRPVGPAFRITGCKGNVVQQLDGLPALETLRSVLDELSNEESSRFRNAPHVGIKESDHGEEGGAGSYLVRGIVGLKQTEGALAIAENVHQGMQLRFHTRDTTAAHDDLEERLSLQSGFFEPPIGALLYTCTGRGTPMFGQSGHDIDLIRHHWPDIPVSGFFAAGEIGPLAGRPYLHGFSACLGLLMPYDGE